MAKGSDTHYCWIEILSAYPKAVGYPQKRQVFIQDFTTLLNAIAPLWINQDIPNINIRSLYPEETLGQFNRLRSALDPNAMFLNGFLKRLNLWD